MTTRHVGGRAEGRLQSCPGAWPGTRAQPLALLDECVGRQLPVHVAVLLVGVLPVVVPLQGPDVARVMAVGAAEG